MTTKKSSKTAASDKPRKKQPSWSDVKSAIAKLERPALLSLISDLYAYSTPNKNFLHARFSLSSDTQALQEDHRRCSLSGCHVQRSG